MRKRRTRPEKARKERGKTLGDAGKRFPEAFPGKLGDVSNGFSDPPLPYLNLQKRLQSF
jgi:hypothetical protein